MTGPDWIWDPTQRINLSECPGDDWEAAYHWLDEETSGDIVVKVDENLDFIAYICEVEG